MLKLTLYSTSACHLCEEAFLVVEQVMKCHQLELNVIDISDSEELLKKYGLDIPVISINDDSFSNLKWPFNTEMLEKKVIEYK